MKKLKKQIKGITLVALVVTIIVLLILAGIAINLTVGNNGLFNRVEKSANEYNQKEATEKMNLKITSTQIKVFAESERMPTLQEIADDFCEDNEIQYVELESKKTASISKVTVGEAKSIFTKLKNYPYEFEIDSTLKLASINGIKIAENNSGIDEDYIRKIVREELDKKIADIQVYGICDVLFDETADKANQTYNLKDGKSINNYDHIIVYASIDDNYTCNIKIPKEKYAFSHYIGAHALDAYRYLVHFKFTSDTTFQISQIQKDGWNGTPKIYRIEGIK